MITKKKYKYKYKNTLSSNAVNINSSHLYQVQAIPYNLQIRLHGQLDIAEQSSHYYQNTTNLHSAYMQ